jgi:hypothetical protein
VRASNVGTALKAKCCFVKSIMVHRVPVASQGTDKFLLSTFCPLLPSTTVGLGWVRLGWVGLGWVRLGSVRLGSVGLVRLGWVRLGWVRLG